MENVEANNTHLPCHLKVKKDMCPKTEDERDKMSKVPFASTIGSLMYDMVCTRLDIAHILAVISRYMSHPIIENWNVVKWTHTYLRGTSSRYLILGGSTTNL